MSNDTPEQNQIRTEDWYRSWYESKLFLKIKDFYWNFDRQKLPPTIYTVSGIILFILLLLIFNTYVIHLKVETAVVSAPIETVTTPVSGFINEVWVLPGQNVHQGAPLVKVENVDLERDFHLAEISAKEAERNISYYQSLLANERERLQVYQNVGGNRVISAKADVDIAKQVLRNAEKNLTRMRALHAKHYLSEADWDAFLANYNTAKEKLRSADAQMSLEDHSLKSVDSGMYFTGNRLEGREKDLTAEVAAAQSRLQLNVDKVKVFANLIAKLTLTAPFDGKIVQVLKSVGNTVDTTKPILLIEQTHAPKEIIAYLTQREIMQLRLHAPVKIYVPTLGNVYHGKVVNVNRTSGFVDEVNAQYRWRDLYIDRSAMVTIVIKGKEQLQFNRDVSGGMPAIVYFPRKFTVF